jgi:hypothetical protein
VAIKPAPPRPEPAPPTHPFPGDVPPTRMQRAADWAAALAVAVAVAVVLALRFLSLR